MFGSITTEISFIFSATVLFQSQQYGFCIQITLFSLFDNELWVDNSISNPTYTLRDDYERGNPGNDICFGFFYRSIKLKIKNWFFFVTLRDALLLYISRWRLRKEILGIISVLCSLINQLKMENWIFRHYGMPNVLYTPITITKEVILRIVSNLFSFIN